MIFKRKWTAALTFLCLLAMSFLVTHNLFYSRKGQYSNLTTSAFLQERASTSTASTATSTASATPPTTGSVVTSGTRNQTVHRLGGGNQSTSIPQDKVAHVPTEPSLSTRRENQRPLSSLYDTTIGYNDTVPRLWLDSNMNLKNASNRPPAQLLLTNYGWNHPNQTFGMTFPRTQRMRLMYQAIVNHPWFHPTAWQDILAGRLEVDPSVRYYVFLDVETCFESNWPNYGAGDRKNADTVGNRIVELRSESPCFGILHCHFMKSAVRTNFFEQALKKNTTATLVAFECRGDGPPVHFRKEMAENWPLALVTISSKWEQLQNPPDMGLPPAAAKPVELTARQEQDMQECKEDARPFLLTFAGNFRDGTRRELKKLHDLKKGVLIARREELNRFWNGTFEEMLADSKFGAAPRGDNTFSYRFTEVLSAGAIPVVHADGWVLPFRPELVDWTECAVHIPENQVYRTLEILAEIDDATRCRMRKRCYDIYLKYMRTHEGTVAGVIEGLELVAKAKSLHSIA
jgi:hypothetical protein